MPISDYFYRLGTYFKSSLLQLNLFKSGIQDELIIQKERRSTRLYLTLLIISIIILVSYYSVTPYTHTVLIKNPTFIKYSTLLKEMSLQCSCKTISVKYEEFVQIEPFYHELCRSDFVSNEYIKQLFILYEQSWNNSNPSDFRRIAVFQFQTLRALCQLTKETIENKLEIFLKTELIEPQLISQESLQIQIGSLLTDFVNMTPKMFLKTLRFIQDTTAQNLFMTGASLTSLWPREQPDFGKTVPYSGMNYTFENGSSCTCSSSTATSCMSQATFDNNIVHGFQTGCYMVNALLKSTLEVFYNQTFVNILTNSSGKFNKLNSSVSNSTIETLLSQMFVTHWLNETFFKQYFNSCTPESCQYTVTERYEFLFIITILIGLFGGLSSVFTIIAPFIILKIWPITLKFIARRQTPVTHVVENEHNTILSVNDRIKEFFRLIKKKLIELNLFDSIPPSQDENILQQQRYTTRIYLILLFLTVVILTLFTSIKPQTIRVIIKSPLLKDFTQLYDQYWQTLDCPCSQPAIDRQFITHIKPQYHEICLSDFVSSNWINVQFYQQPFLTDTNGRRLPTILTNDIRYQFQFHFQLLSTLCHMTDQTIQDSLQSFNRTKFVTNKMLSSQSFQTQIDLIVEQFKRTVPESFQRTLNLLKTNFATNLFVTPMNSRFMIVLNVDNMFEIKLYEPIHELPEKHRCKISSSVCICSPSYFEECYQQTVIRDNGTTYNISGMFQTWFPLQSLLMSTLECFYQDTCLSQIIQYINTTASPINFTTLNSSLLSLNNNQNDTIELLANNLFIQTWNNKSSFESYFNHCRPLTCQYTYESRLNLIYIVTTIIGLIGGVNIFLGLLLPYVVKLVTKMWNYILHHQQEQSISMKTRFYHCVRTLLISGKQTMVKLNFFDSIPPSNDPNIIRRNRYTTRAYLVLLITAFFILILYTSLRQVTITVIVKSPSVSKYTELSLQYPLTLQCPCNRIGIKYKEFIPQIDPQYHQICSSVFSSPEWIESMTFPDIFIRYSNTEYNFLKAAHMQFQIVEKLCTLSKNMLNTSLSIFKDTDFITLNAISRDEFNVRTEPIIEQFKTKVSNEFMDVLKLIKITNHGNQLATVYSSNWRFITKYSKLDIPKNIETLNMLLTLPQTYGAENCSCGIQSNCSQLSEINFYIPNQSVRRPILGFRLGCLILDSTLQSSLACLYNQTCLDMIQSVFYLSKPVPAKSLTYSPLLPPNTTIEKLLSQLFVSEWFNRTSFDHYFNECAPQSCQYSYSRQYNPVYVVTTIMALFGGLTQGLRFVLYYIQLIIIKSIDRRKKKNQVTPCSNPLNIAVIDRDNNTIEMDSIEATTTVQPSVNLVNEQTISGKKYRDRAIIVCLSMLSVAAIVTISVIWLMNRNEEQKFISSTTRTTQINTISTITESTSTSTNRCYMTLKHQSQIYPTGLSPMSVIIDHFNQDSIVDLAVTNYDSHTLSIMLGNGNGTFQTQQIHSTGNGSGPTEITVGYLNNDTLLDLAVVLNGTKGIAIFFGVATNILFLSPRHLFLNYGNIPIAVVASDLNNDGVFDLLVSRHSKSYFDDTMSILLNLGDGRQFQSRSNIGIWPIGNINSIVIGHFHKDGNRKGLALCTIDSEVTTYDIYDYNAYTILPSTRKLMYAKPSILVKGKFNDDELDDLALISSQSDTLQILFNYYGREFIPQIYLTYSYPTSVARINFNNDTIDDLAILSCNGTVTVFLGTKFGMFDRNYLTFEMSTSNSGKCSQSLKVADLNQDGMDDLVFIDAEINSIRVLLGTHCNE